MRTFKVLVATLILAIAACRSVPSEVKQAHELSKTESVAAVGLATDMLLKIEEKSAELNDDLVTSAFVSWTSHRVNIDLARATVMEYLQNTDAGLDVTNPYIVGARLLRDMDRGFLTITRHWEAMLLDERSVDRAIFIERFRKDIGRFETLERKFDEWMKQYRVGG